MPRRTNNLLGLSTVTPDSAFDQGGALISLDDIYPMAAGGRRIVAEAHRQRMGMVAQAIKADFADQKIGEVNQRAHRCFAETAENMLRVKSQTKGTELEAYMEEFTHHAIQLTSQHMTGMMKIHAAAQAQEAARTPYPPEPPEPEGRPGFFKRLFGGG
jgi:hypothetical protein